MSICALSSHESLLRKDLGQHTAEALDLVDREPVRREVRVIGGARGPDLGVRVARIQDASYPVALEEVREAGEVGGGEGSGIAVPNDLGDREPVHLDVAAEEPVQEDLLALGIGAPEAPARGSNDETSCI